MSGAGVYKIHLIISGKVYVGGTNSWERRLGEHRSTLRSGKHCNKHLQAAWEKYGEGAFEFSLLESVSDMSHLVAREQHWIEQLHAATDGFNMCPAAGTRRGVPHTPEHKARISAAKLGHVQSESTRALIRAARAKQIVTPESIAKTRAGNTGKKRTAEARQRMSAGCTGRTLSAETRAKVAAANLGKKATAETRAKMSVSATGHIKSPEHRAALSAALTGKKLSPGTVAKRQATRRTNQGPHDGE